MPGILVLRADDTIESATPEADGWLAQLAEQWLDRLPAPVYNVAHLARAVAAGKPVPGAARGRIRLASGAWLTIRATVLAGATASSHVLPWCWSARGAPSWRR